MYTIAENVYGYDYKARLMLGVYFPVRSTLIELSNNELLAISPGPLEIDVLNELNNRYQTIHCIAPNLFHHLHLQHITNTLPTANIFGPSALIQKQPWLKDRLQNINQLATSLQTGLIFIPVNGCSFLSETLVYHPSSKTLVITDLLFNMRKPQAITTRCLLTMVGAYNKTAQSRLIRKSITDPQAYKNSLSSLTNLRIDRIVPAHGDIITGKAQVEHALTVLMPV